MSTRFPRSLPALAGTTAAIGAAMFATAASAQIEAGPYSVKLVPIATGLVAPIQAKHANDGSGRLFVVEQNGIIRIIQNGSLLPTPFLDLRSLLVPLNNGYDERGLLGLAFHPDYATNGRFFVHYTIRRTGTVGNPGDACASNGTFGCSSEVIAEYRVSSSNANIADPASGIVLLTVPKPQFNHAGGGLDFGPDGYLYIALGDGGGANDGLSDNPPSHGPIGNAQNLAVALGKILRYDVSTRGVLAIPPTNPYAGDPTKFQGIFVSGVRNPYAFSFDEGPGSDGKFYIGEVGQDAYEEVNILDTATDAGRNLAWPIREGLHCFDPFNTTTPPPNCGPVANEVLPVVEYPHAAAGSPIGLAVVGGAVYRGTNIPAMSGLYIFGDFSTSFGAADGHLFYFDPREATPTVRRLRVNGSGTQLGLFVKGFGRDQNQEQYLLTSTRLGPSGTGGAVYRIARCPSDFNADGFLDFFDFDDFVLAFESGDLRADINGDNFIDFFDFDDYVLAFERGC
jgi:glucose/arabinose dehydrogenase